MRTSAARIGLIAALVALLAAAAWFDDPATARRPVTLPEETETVTVGADPIDVPSRTELDHAMPVAPVVTAASTTWFCGGGAATDRSARDTTLIVTNRATAPSRVRISATGADGSAATATRSVPPTTSIAVPLREVLEADWVASVVEASGGGVVVTQRLGNDSSVTTTACATSSSDRWYFATGTTDRAAKELLVLYNPFADLVTADVAFLTAEGFRQPQAVHGVPVPAGAVVVLDVGEVEDRKVDLASIVSTRAGRLVVWRTQTFSEGGPELTAGFVPRGVSSALGQSSATERFVLPTAVTGEGVAPRLAIANPGTEDSRVVLTLVPDDPATNGRPPERTVEVAAGAVTIIDSGELQQVADGVPFSVHGRVASGGPVVAELWLDGAEPARGHGAFATASLPIAAKRWVVPRGLQTVDIDQIGIHRSGSATDFTVRVVDAGGAEVLSGPSLPESVGPDGRVSIDLDALLGDRSGAALLVEADAPVTVTRLQAGTDARGLVSYPAIPVAGTFVEP